MIDKSSLLKSQGVITHQCTDEIKLYKQHGVYHVEEDVCLKVRNMNIIFIIILHTLTGTWVEICYGRFI